jgi:hypothetical protein
LGYEDLFSPFWPPKIYFFLLHVNFPNDGYITRLYLFWAPNFVFELWRLTFAFLTPKVYFILLHLKFSIDGYITRPYWFWVPNSDFGLWRLIFAFLTHKSIFFLAPCKFPERWIYHTTIPILGPKFRFWALKTYFRLTDP